MKNAICKTMDVLGYISFAIVFLCSFLAFISGEIVGAIIVLVVGWIICCIFSAFWFVMSGIFDQMKTQNQTLAEMSKHIKNIEANNNWLE